VTSTLGCAALAPQLRRCCVLSVIHCIDPLANRDIADQLRERDRISAGSAWLPRRQYGTGRVSFNPISDFSSSCGVRVMAMRYASARIFLLHVGAFYWRALVRF
jgi:hypothetical protein